MAKGKTVFVDSSYVPEIYADAGTGTFTPHGNMKITLESWRVDHSEKHGALQRVVIGRLVMPLDQAEELAKNILEVAANRKAESEKAEKPQSGKKEPTAKSTKVLQ